ncbi:MAG: glucose-1-phosphate adenylyltransferase [Ignavibacteria bacterium]|jgi:glucose-1-phosphate adenylyltransferase
MLDVLALILGGGRGTRLYPLTEKRSKPAVPLAGKYRLIDIPISNCINAGIDKIDILTQFRSVSLHRHIASTYRRDIFTKGWVDILAAEQTPRSDAWYQGTADAVRQQLVEIINADTKYILILAGDHLYQMDYREFVDYHISTEADITIAVQPVEEDLTSALGILKRDTSGAITDFCEKPDKKQLSGLVSLHGTKKPYMASMGIYVFTTDLLIELLKTEGNDFGKDIIPKALGNYKVMGHIFEGYWADIGTIRRFYEVNLEMTSPDPPFKFDMADTIYTHPRFLPPTEIQGAKLNQVLVADGCKIGDSQITNSVIGLRSRIDDGAVIKDSILMGADFYETNEMKEENRKLGRPDIGIGVNSIIESAIVDKNARIGKNVRITKNDGRDEMENENWAAREGLVIIPKNGIIPDNTVI